MLLEINVQELLDTAGNFLAEYGLRFLGAVILLIIGLWLSGKASRIIYRMMEKREVDPSLRSFMKSVVGALLRILVIITILTLVGVPMTSFIAILGAAGLAVGLALSGTLQNFAGGVLLLIIKPFKVDDFIEAQGFMGTVKDIQIFHTVLQTVDNVIITVPNGGLSTGSVTNYSINPTRRGQWVFGIAYGDSVETAKKAIMDVLENDSRVLNDPEPMIFLSKLNDSSVDITVRAWAKAEDFWPFSFAIHEKVYDAFQKAGINIPFPQMDVHLHKKDKS